MTPTGVVPRGLSGGPRAHWLAALAALGIGCACSSRGAGAASGPRRPPLIAEASSSRAFESPARLRYHPRDRARTLSELKLPGGERLLVGERGERWLFDPQSGALSAGSMLAPEPLIATLVEGATYWFIGASGTSYAASTPLGAFERSSAPIEPLSGVAAAGNALVGVRQQRSLLRSEDFGASWSEVGPQQAAFVDIAMAPAGVGLALSVPEALYGTRDFGRTWAPVAAPPLGVVELEPTVEGGIRALTPLGEQRWNETAQRFEPEPRHGSATPIPSPPRGPDAGALAEGRAVLLGTSYLELARFKGRDGFQLLSGPLEGPLTAAPVAEATGCRAVRLAAFREHIAFACFRAGAETATQPIELWLSHDRGARFQRVLGRFDGTLAGFRLAIGDGGVWVASGVCSPGAPASGCTPSGVQVARRASGSGARANAKTAAAAGSAAATPSLADSALALGFSPDGRTAYAVGRRTKTGRFALFVSRDTGKTFEPEDLELGQLVSSEDDDEDFVERSPGTRVEFVSAAEDGAVAIGFVHYGKRTLVVTDERGKLLSTAMTPEDRALMSASGLRALAVAPKARQVWESLDGGVTWDPSQSLPLDLCPGDESCDIPIRCSPHGCVIGHEFTRIGWGRNERADVSLLLPPLRPVRAPLERRVRMPIACTFEQAPFRPLVDVLEAPTAHDAAIGSADWYAVAEDPNRASVTVLRASHGRIDSARLLDPVVRAEEYAYVVLDQVEGVAALRYRVPESVPGKTSLTDVEVVWDDILAGKRARARIADGGQHVAGDFVVGRGRARRAQPELVSIASGGLYVRLHARAPDQPTLFFDGNRVESLAPIRWPRDERFPARSEIVHADGAHSPILLVGRGAAIVRASRSNSGWSYDAYATGMIAPGDFGFIQVPSIAYIGGRAGLHLEVHDVTGASRAAVFPFRGVGDVVDKPVPVPTQRALGERPNACDADARKRTPRVVATPQPGTRHPVVITDTALGPRTFLTGYAVLHGTESEACAAAFEAVSVPTDGAPAVRESALIFLDRPEHSVLFRVAGDRESARIEHRLMACRFDPTLEVPPDIFKALSRAERVQGWDIGGSGE